MAKIEINMLHEPTVELVKEGKAIASCPCGAFLYPEEVRDLKCQTCGQEINFSEMLLQSTEFIPKC